MGVPIAAKLGNLHALDDAARAAERVPRNIGARVGHESKRKRNELLGFQRPRLGVRFCDAAPNSGGSVSAVGKGAARRVGMRNVTFNVINTSVIKIRPVGYFLTVDAHGRVKAMGGRMRAKGAGAGE